MRGRSGSQIYITYVARHIYSTYNCVRSCLFIKVFIGPPIWIFYRVLVIISLRFLVLPTYLPIITLPRVTSILGSLEYSNLSVPGVGLSTTVNHVELIRTIPDWSTLRHFTPSVTPSLPNRSPFSVSVLVFSFLLNIP